MLQEQHNTWLPEFMLLVNRNRDSWYQPDHGTSAEPGNLN